MKLLLLRHVASLLGIVAAASVITAPTALATGSAPNCADVSRAVSAQCRPSNAAINDSGPVQFGPVSPYWASGYQVGDHGGGYR
jgi:hypothetical protein